ncbi:MAG TPA: DUF4446 family protein [Patescibacteria group bacterium]|nr:DUF4446 family protein [Patescibacteria group bacterium]
MQVFLISSVFGIWLIVISIVIYRIFALFNKLTKGVEVTDLKKVLEKVLAQEIENKKEVNNLLKRVSAQEEAGKLHIQKVGLVRFNPFKELGGDHSFSLSILDGEDSGFVITSLHTRDRTRVYMKRVLKGKGDIELSEEEKSAVSKAK